MIQIFPISNIILVKFLNCWYFSLLFLFFSKQFKFHLVHFVIVVPIEFWCKNKRKTEKSVYRVNKQTRSENNLKHFMYFNIFLLSFCLTLVPARSCRLFLILHICALQSKMRRKWEDRLLLYAVIINNIRWSLKFKTVNGIHFHLRSS